MELFESCRDSSERANRKCIILHKFLRMRGFIKTTKINFTSFYKPPINADDVL